MKKKKFATGTRVPGMTLTELLIVLAILGILILLAYPVITPIFQKAHAKEAQLQLKHLQELEKIYFLEHAQYSNELKTLGFEQSELVSEGGKGTAHYKIEIVEASGNSFLARANAVTDFDGDGQLNVWEISESGGAKETRED